MQDIHIIGITEGEERKGLRKHLKTTAKNFLNIGKETLPQAQGGLKGVPSPIKAIPEEDHDKTHSNQIDQN